MLQRLLKIAFFVDDRACGGGIWGEDFLQNLSPADFARSPLPVLLAQEFGEYTDEYDEEHEGDDESQCPYDDVCQ